MPPRYLEAWERTYYLFVCSPGLGGYLTFSLQVVLVFEVFFCLLNGNNLFSHLKKRYLVYFLPSFLLVPPSHMSTAPCGHIFLQSFSAAWLFSEQV